MRLPHIVAALSVGLRTWTAHACTVCDSRNGQQLRAGLFDGHFVHTALLVGAPVPALLFAVLFSQSVLLRFTLPSVAGVDISAAFADSLAAELPA